MRSIYIALLDVVLYASSLFAIELAKEWNTIGAQGLRQYDFYDWLILFVGVWAVTGVTINAYFSSRFHKRLAEEKEEKKQKQDTSFIPKP